jgi:hypothetical protein
MVNIKCENGCGDWVEHEFLRFEPGVWKQYDPETGVAHHTTKETFKKMIWGCAKCGAERVYGNETAYERSEGEQLPVSPADGG